MDVAAYLHRIQYRGSLRPSAETLRELHRRHLFAVPFENFDIALGIPIVLDPATLFEKIVVRHRGGFCYELNGLFHELLLALGFHSERLSASVRRDDGGFGPEFDHMLLKVSLEQPWLADVGFGESFLDPLPFHPGVVEDEGRRYSVLRSNDEWQLLRLDPLGQVPLYKFRDKPHRLNEYNARCRYHQMSPESLFHQRRVCTRAMPDGRVTLSGLRLIVTRNSAREEFTLSGEQELRHCLRHYFGVEFEDTTDLSPLLARAA